MKTRNSTIMQWHLFSYLLILYSIVSYSSEMTGHCDVTFFGAYMFSDGIGRRVIGQIETLKDLMALNFRSTRPEINTDADINPSVLQILHTAPEEPGTVMVFLDIFSEETKRVLYKHYRDHKIKFAYVTIESTKAPDSWVHILNNIFDGVLVPDHFCVNTLQNSGVTKPIFILPEICYLEEFLETPIQETPHHPFVFGVTANAYAYKNYDLLLEAFAEEFGNSSDVVLKIHNHFMAKSSIIIDKIKSLNLNNVMLTDGSLSRSEYFDHLNSIDCYVLLSKGEGFSITPREALALGRPCILANHTAHQTICNTGYVQPIDANIIEKHNGENYGGEDVGNVFNCELTEVRKALRTVYENYALHVQKAVYGRTWVKQYLAHNLQDQYLAILKPKKILLGEKNQANLDHLVTNSLDLYSKFKNYICQDETA